MLRIEAVEVPIRIDEQGVARVGKTRVPIDTVIFAFNRGDHPQEIVERYPVLKLADVYAVIAYYLGSQAEVDTYLEQRKMVEPSEDMDEDRILIFSTYQNVKVGMVTANQFGEVIEGIDWTKKPPELFEVAIRYAIEIDASVIARELSEKGHERFPEHKWLAKSAQILAPPKVVSLDGEAKPSLKPTIDWFRDHADEYVGQWVAVNMGQLVGVHQTRRELIALIGEYAMDPNTLVTKVY